MHQLIINTITSLNQNKFFKFVSSIRLAVPVMLGLIVAVAAGTIFESRYNSDIARLAVYDSVWFNIILALLALNIFASMMSRYPWKERHIGFVTTHIGILILLAGSLVTKVYGLDGSLQIVEGQSGNSVFLPQLMLAYQFDGSPTGVRVEFNKVLFDQEGSSLNALNDSLEPVLRVEKFYPFAEVDKGYDVSGDATSGPVGIGFQMKSPFFDVKEWLHSVDQPSLQMGPATLKLVLEDGPLSPAVLGKEKTAMQVKIPEPAPRKSKPPTGGDSQVLMKEVGGGKTVKTFSLAQLEKGVQFKDLELKILKNFNRAVVAENKIVENLDPTAPPNPAVEIMVRSKGEEKREILYAKFPQFSIHNTGIFGFRFEFRSSGQAEPAAEDSRASNSELPAGHPAINSSEAAAAEPSMQAAAMAANGGGNVIEFHVSRQQPQMVRVDLLKGGKKITSQEMKEGDRFRTPWMGMELYLASIGYGSQATTTVRSVRPKAGAKNMPASALYIKARGAEQGFWLSQGEVKAVSLAGKPAHIVFANQTFELPFSLKLEKFTKKDYPGTETPYSYESLVRDDSGGETVLISMNEPLKKSGYTLYQASFAKSETGAPVSVLSVNRDPGRAIKYIGSLILSLGIAIFTLMRSRVYRKIRGS